MRPKVRSKVKTILIFAAALLVLAIPLMFFLEDFVRDAILLPLAYIAWLLGIIVGALPQRYFLAAVVALGVYIAIRSLGRNREDQKQRVPHAFRVRGNLTLWADRLRLMARGAYSKQRFRYHLGRLALDIIAHEYRITSSELSKRIRNGDIGTIEIPEDIQPYIQSAVNSRYMRERFQFQIVNRLLTWLKRKLKVGKASDDLQRMDQEIDRVITALQTILGTESERGS
jgi:hypothetical protein